MKKPKTCLAAQMYTLRAFTKTPEAIAATMKKVREIGYQAVQLSALGPIPTADLKKIMDQEGLTVCATHVPFERMRDDPDGVIAEHRALECDYTAVGGAPDAYRNPEGYVKFAKEASAVAKRLKAGGLTWGYHNHNWEYEKVNGRTIMEIFRTESDPEVFTFELDTYWVAAGGGDPIEWIKQLKGRVPAIHLKDMTMKDRTQLMAEIGEGNLNWPGILKACKQSGVKWYIIEQDVCQRDPFESLAISLRNLNKMGLK